MKFIRIAAALGLAAVVVPSAAYAQQGWQSINARQARLDARIDQGVRSGSLNRREAARVRTEFRQLSQLERRYRVGGLSNAERREIDRRFDALSARVRFEKHDGQNRGDGYGRNDRPGHPGRR